MPTKTKIFFSIFTILFLIPTFTIAAAPAFTEIKPRLQIPILNVTNFSSAYQSGGNGLLYLPYLPEYISLVYNYLVGIAGLLAISMIVYGGIKWIFSGGDSGKIGKAKETIVNAVIGLVLALGSYIILYTLNPNLVSFKALGLKYIKIEFISSENSGDVITATDLSTPRQGTNHVPLFKQSDYLQPYGRCGTIKSSGCGPTSMAMVLKFYNINVDPVLVANSFANENFRACSPNSCDCQGTAYLAFINSNLLKQNNLIGTQLGNDKEQIMQILRTNKPVIVVVGPQARGLNSRGTSEAFTSGGHYIVLTGIDADSNIMVNDPAKALMKARPDDLFPGIKNAWYIRPQSQ